MFDICSTTEKWVTEGYIRSPNYPEHYPAEQACMCTLEASWNAKGITVDMDVYELLLEKNKRDECADWLVLEHGGKRDRYCGQMLNQKISVPSSQVKLYFFSDGNDRERQEFEYFQRKLKGFWLHFRCK